MSTQQLAPTLKPGSQNSRILARLRKAKGGWVSLPKLVEASGSYAVATRVSEIKNALIMEDLKRRGLWMTPPTIENRTRRNSKGIVESFYRLVE